MKSEILYGIHPVSEALKSGSRQFMALYVTRDKTSSRLTPLLHLAETRKIPVEIIPESRLTAMAGSDRHQGIGARVSPCPISDFSEVLEGAESGGMPFLLLLDNLEDPQNLGALIRTALCAGVQAVVLPRDRSASPTPAVSKASAGALEHMSVDRVTNMARTIGLLKDRGIWVFGLDAAGDRTVYDCDFTVPLALVVGGEDTGVRPLVKKNCDALIAIPQTGMIGSLNASVAGAVAMYEVFRQRRIREDQRPDF